MIVPREGAMVCAGAVLLSLLALCEREARAAPLEARAAPLLVRLEYAAGPGCPDAADFKAVVIARLGLRPFQRNRARARAGPHRAAHRDHRRTHRVARCERQMGRRAGIPVGEHRLSPPGARDGARARDPDSAPGEG